jgi:hypothetical protein
MMDKNMIQLENTIVAFGANDSFCEGRFLREQGPWAFPASVSFPLTI